MRLLSPTLLLLATTAAVGCIDNELIQPPPEPQPAIEVEPLVLDFGALESGQALTLETTIRSVGEAPLVVGELTLDAPENYEVLFDALPLTLHPGEEQAVAVEFTAIGDGDTPGTLHVGSWDPDRPDVPVALHGAGLAPAIELDPPAFDFGEQQVDCDVAVDVVVRSVGSYPLQIDDYFFLASPVSSAMQLHTTELVPGMQLAPGEEATVRVVFTPQDAATYDGLLSVTSDDPAQPHAEATQVGDGVPADWASDLFVQEGGGAADILWVVDNSDSMFDEQGKLADDFVHFYDTIDAAAVDYRIAVVTTDSSQFQGSTKVIAPGTPDGAQVFADNCSLGTNGGDQEQGLRFGLEALQLATAGTAPNQGFFREHAALRVVFVSDENDQSGDWSDYLDQYLALKDDPDDVVLSAICGTDGIDATFCYGLGGSAVPGLGYVDVAHATGGLLAGICDEDWSQTLTSLGSLSQATNDTFPLSAEPLPASLEVRLNGAPLTSGWTYDPSVDSFGAVVFDAGQIPEDGDQVEVLYGVTGPC